MVDLRLPGQRRAMRSMLLKVSLVVLALCASSAIVYGTGGTQGRFGVLTHLYYIPIVASALSFGPVAGVLAALTASVLGGPLMPADVTSHVMQPASDWLTRAFFFIVIGATVGGLAAQLRGILETERQQREQLNRFTHEILAAFTEAVAERDLYTGTHVTRIAEYAGAIAERLGLPRSQVETIQRAAQLHDIGKLAIPTEILRKPGRLNRREWEVIQQHPVIGSQILERLSVLRDAAPLVRHHHERYDGMGYPAGLRSDKIPLGSRIIAVADAFDAMTSDRPYRCALSFAEAIEELRWEAGRQFDPEIVHVFLDTFSGERHEAGERDLALLLLGGSAHDAAVANMIHHNGQCHVNI